MSFQDFLNFLGWKGTTFWGVMIFLASLGMEFIPKIKLNPWTALIKWIGSRFNKQIDTKLEAVREEIKGLDKKVDTLQTEVGKVQGDLTDHIKESEMKSLQDTRRDILDFANSCMNKRKHTQEQFRFILKQCDEYELYIEKNHLKNGEIKNAIEEIRRLHKRCMQDNSFLKEGEENHDE